MNIEFRIYENTDQRLADFLETSSGKMLVACAEEMRIQMVNLAGYVKANKLSGDPIHRRSGALSRGVHPDTEEDGRSITGTVGVDGTVPYARILHEGGSTRPHDIEPSRGRALCFMWGGQQRFFRRVHHPGSRFPARPYLTSAMDEQREEIFQRLFTSINEAIKQ